LVVASVTILFVQRDEFDKTKASFQVVISEHVSDHLTCAQRDEFDKTSDVARKFAPMETLPDCLHRCQLRCFIRNRNPSGSHKDKVFLA